MLSRLSTPATRFKLIHSTIKTLKRSFTKMVGARESVSIQKSNTDYFKNIIMKYITLFRLLINKAYIQITQLLIEIVAVLAYINKRHTLTEVFHVYIGIFPISIIIWLWRQLYGFDIVYNIILHYVSDLERPITDPNQWPCNGHLTRPHIKPDACRPSIAFGVKCLASIVSR